jgi:signal transduction histidine kinase
VSGRGESERLSRLQSVTDAALAHLELERLLDELLQRIRDLLDVDTCAILLLDRETDELVARATLGIEEGVEAGVRIPVGRGFAGRIAAERRPIFLPDVDHADILDPILREKGVKSLLGVPLVAGEEVVGVLHVGSLTPRTFGREDEELLQLVADRAALAIEHGRAFEAERLARKRLEHLQAVTDAALTHLELEQLLQELLQRIRGILDVDTCAILLLDRETDELVARAALGIEEEVEAGVRVPLGRGFAGRVAAQRRAIFLPDVDHADVFNPILREKGIKSLLGVPLTTRDEVIGVLHVGSLTPRTFGRDDVELLQLVVDRAALAIERARVHDEIVRLDEMKLNFVAIASHELRTPAAAVYGLLTTLRSRANTLPPETREQMEEVAWEQSDRMRRLIEQLLDLARLDARTVAVEPRPLVLRRLLHDIALSIAPEAGIEVDVPGDLAIVADPLVVERVMANVVGNAIRHGRPPIRISAEQRDMHVRVAVEDAGQGVPEELVPRLFERFERGSGGGSGLGLSIAKAYANAHGGELVYHRVPGGTRFELILPR